MCPNVVSKVGCCLRIVLCAVGANTTKDRSEEGSYLRLIGFCITQL